MSSMCCCGAIRNKMRNSTSTSRHLRYSTSSRMMIPKPVIEYINEEQVIGRTPDAKSFKKWNIQHRTTGLNHKHRCPRCRKIRAFSLRGFKAWFLDTNKQKYVCGFCIAKEHGNLKEFQDFKKRMK